MSRTVFVGLGVCATLIALPVMAQSPGARLHVNIPGDTGLRALPPGVLVAPQSEETLRATAGNTWNDASLPSDDVLRPRPAWTGLTRSIDTETRSPPGFTLRYEEVFSPSIAPFKRTAVYDSVDDLGRLTVRDPSLHPIRVGWRPWPATETSSRFTGDALIELSPTAPTPIPSVAGDQAVLSYRTTPSVPLAFFEDSAANLYVRANVHEARRVRLVWVLEAPERALSAPRIPNTPVSTATVGTAAPTVPAFVARDSPDVLERIGLRPQLPVNVVLARLTEYFRSFRDGDLTTPPGTRPYRSLALGGVGACRHRAYAFMLTAQSLGLATRYAGNEAHAWVEVLLPDLGWTRIDLGGWNVPFEPTAPSTRQQFRPENPDVLPQPAEYTNGYSTNPTRGTPHSPRSTHDAASRPTTETPGNTAPSPSPTAQSLGEAATPPERVGTSLARLEGPQGRSVNDSNEANSTGRSNDSQPTEPARNTDNTPSRWRRDTAIDTLAERAPRTVTRLTLDEVTPVNASATRHGVLRGTMVRCVGTVRDDTGRAIGNLPVRIELMQGAHVRPLGVTVSDQSGRWDAQVLVPLDLGPGRYELSARTLGDATHSPARAD